MDDLGLVNPGFAFFLERFRVTTPDEWTDRGYETRCLTYACKTSRQSHFHPPSQQSHSDIVQFALSCVLCQEYESATLTPCCPLFTPQDSRLVMMMLPAQCCITVRKKQLSSGRTPAEICQIENENKDRPIHIRKSHINAPVSV